MRIATTIRISLFQNDGHSPLSDKQDLMSEWHLYIIRTRNGALYTGVTTDVARRLDEHSHSKKGAKFLRSKGPLQLVYQQLVGSRSEAQRLEYQIKQLSKQQKEKFIATHSA